MNLDDIVYGTGVSEAVKTEFKRLKHISTAAENSRSAIFASDLDGRVTYANLAAAQMWGFKDRSEMIGTSAMEYWAEASRAEAGKVLQNLSEKGNYRGDGLVGKRKDGAEFVVRFSAGLIKDGAGRPVGLTGSFEDMTERKQAEEALRANEEKYRILLEASFDLIYVIGRDDTIQYANPAALKGIERPAAEIIGKPWATFFSPEVAAKQKQALDRVFSTGEPSFNEEKAELPPGIRWQETHLIPLKSQDGMIYAVLGISRDITERKRAEEALKESEHRYRLLADNATDVVWTLDLKTKNSTYFSPSVYSMLGYTPEEALTFPLEKRMTPESYRKIMNELQEGIRIASEPGFDPNSTHMFQYEGLCKDGSTLFLETKVKFLYDEIGRPVSIIGTSRDITERKQMERALVEKERLSAIGEIVSGVAHDFNNSLQAIFGNIELALLEMDMPKAIREYLAAIKTSASDAAMRVQQLQRFAGKGIKPAEWRAVNLNTMVEETIAQSRPKWKDETEKKGHFISIRKKYGEIRPVDGNLAELRSAFYNLIKNAVEAMPTGGELTFETGCTDKGVYVRVIDTGTGMDEETKKRIFQPFFSTKGFESGRGLGMSAVYSIIKEHRGEIYVKASTPGQGTTLEVILPFGQEKTEVPLKETLSEGQSSARVLLVDDEEMIRDVTQKLLEKLGHKADVAACGEEALRLLEDKQYDLIITDIGMPNMSGWQLAERIKGRHKACKVAVVTGWGADVTREDKDKFGIGYVLGKPVALKDLKNMVEEVLQLKHK